MLHENDKKRISCNSVLRLKKVRELKEMEVSRIPRWRVKSEPSNEISKELKILKS
jgi:hypothetical protein